MAQFVVKVTTEGHEFSGTNMVGPFEGERAFEVERELNELFAASLARRGLEAVAFPHGVPTVEVIELLDWTVAKLAWNWIGSDEFDEVSR